MALLQEAANAQAQPEQQSQMGSGAPPQSMGQDQGPDTEGVAQDRIRGIDIALRKIIHENDQTNDRIMQSLDGDTDNDIEAVANAAITVVNGIKDKSQGQFSDKDFIPAMLTAAGYITELGKTSGKIEVGADFMKRVTKVMMEKAVKMYGNNPEALKSFMALMPKDEKAANEFITEEEFGGDNGQPTV